jgi:hypothetical protein
MGRPKRGEEKKPRPPQTGSETQFLEFTDLMRRWSVSRQALERWSRLPDFPAAYRLADSTVRRYRESDIEQYERRAVTKRGGAK